MHAESGLSACEACRILSCERQAFATVFTSFSAAPASSRNRPQPDRDGLPYVYVGADVVGVASAGAEPGMAAGIEAGALVGCVSAGCDSAGGVSGLVGGVGMDGFFGSGGVRP